MLPEKLRLLEQKIKEIDAMKPIDFLQLSLTDFHRRYNSVNSYDSRQLNMFLQQMKHMISTYEKTIPSEVLSSELYNMLIHYVRKIVILSYAEQLGIEPGLYKKQMDFLFKGKS